MWPYWLKKEILNGKLHFLPNESRLTCRSSDITKHSHKKSSTLRFEDTFHSSWPLFPQQVTYIEKKRKLYTSAPSPPLPQLPIQPNNLFSSKLLHPFRYHLHFAILKGNNSLQHVVRKRRSVPFGDFRYLLI